ncbi:hypothetical protein JXM67_00600 [candidate division WOR-3 bacterium]|nr:hypothetical protein [candidate division WOR-3 bacterium]
MNALLEDYSPEEAKGQGEFKFLGWLFLLQQGAAVILIVGLLAKLFPLMYVGGVLDIISQNTLPAILIVFALLHAGVVFLLFVRRPFAWTIILCFLGGMAVFSAVELFLGPFNIYNLAGIILSVLWIAFFLFSKRPRIRFFYDELFSRASQTIICPHCKEEVLLDAEKCCGKPLSEEDRFRTLCERTTDPKVPVDVRVAQFDLLAERFGKKALPFLKEQYDKQMKSPVRIAKVLAALNRILESHS